MSLPKILLDVFPANVIVAPENTYEHPYHDLYPKENVPNTLYRQVTRIIVTDTRVIVALDTPEGAMVIGNEEYDYLDKGTKPDFLTRIVTKSGKQIAFYKDNGCGCSSRLRSWNPFNVIMSTKG